MAEAQSWDEVADWYASADWGLSPDEFRVLGECWPAFAGRRVLDVGVGSGRTLRFLAPVVSSYCGIDYSAAMIAAARRRYPQCDLREGDARELRFADQSFDFVLFSYNGIDYVEPEDRARVLSEVFRVLTPGGTFVFSSHNRLALEGGVPDFTPPPVATHFPTPLHRVWRRLQERRARRLARANFERVRGKQWVKDDVAFICDGVHESRYLTCYISPRAVLRELETAGFSSDVRIIGWDARPATVDSRDTWLYYRTSKPGS